MKTVKNGIKATFFAALLLSAALFILIFILSGTVQQNYKINKGESFNISGKLPFTAEIGGKKSVDTANGASGEKYEVSLKIFGVIPFSTVNVEVVDEQYVCVLGQPFGMRIYTDGVLVVSTKNVTSASGEVNPARLAGIKVGDYIASVDGYKVTTNEDLLDLVEKSKGKKLKFEIKRGNQTLFLSVTPIRDKNDGSYHVGIMVRDSSAGIGTLTFYSPTANTVCGLGHALNDSDTEEELKIDSGQMVQAEILSVTKGKNGSPGELNGRFADGVIGEINLNCQNGVYGMALEKISSVNLTKVALKQEVENGEAQILCTVSGDTPKLYSCKVERAGESIFGGEKKLIVTVTDKKLLSKTGGIVQGMSGSPILQNGRLIGAVTHVLVDDPTTGYGVYAENMLETAQSVASGNKLKDAS